MHEKFGIPLSADRIRIMRSHFQQHIRSVTGGTEPHCGIELAVLVKMVANLYESIGAQPLGHHDLSSARWDLLIRLMGEERRGNIEGLTPTYLSRCQNVSKNTISALLRGLEEQGLIHRDLDPSDHRLFRIQLSDGGRALVQSSWPQRLAHLNQLASDLNVEEQAQLTDLLEKLYRSLLQHGNVSAVEHPHPVNEDKSK